MARLQRLRRAYLTLSRDGDSRPASWSEWDMAFPQMRGVSLQPTGYWVTADLLVQQVQRVGFWLSSLVATLEADTWYGIDQLCRLIYQMQRDLLIPDSQRSWWNWMLDGQPLDSKQFTLDRWMKTTGQMIETWLTGPATWLLMVQVGFVGGRSAVFRRLAVPPAGAAQAPPSATRCVLCPTA